MSEIERKHFRTSIPKEHRTDYDTRLRWLWNQRFGTVQRVWQQSSDVLDKTAATLIIQAVVGRDLDSIALLLQRLEGGSLVDEEVKERTEMRV